MAATRWTRSRYVYAELLDRNLPEVRDRIARAELDAGRSPRSVRLIAVTKAHPVEAVEAALAAGLTHLGENRVEELEAKTRIIGREPTWHLIGHVQSRKAKRAAACADLVHSVDNLKLARKLSRAVVEGARGCEPGSELDILVQVNVSGEASKSGLDADGAVDTLLEMAELSGLKLAGLMTMAPFGADVGTLRRTFGGLRRTSEETRKATSRVGPELSMGMTGDLDVAIAEGSTMVRIGTALFGPRPRPGATNLET